MFYTFDYNYDERFTSLNISGIVIKYCNINKIKINNLKLQKILYYIYCAFLIERDIEIFKDDILCGKYGYGPAIENVYHNYKVYENDNINKPLKYKNLDLTKQDYELICKVILSYKYYDEMDMIKKTLSEEPCLKENLKEYNYIDKEKIKYYYSNNKRKIYGSFIPCI